MEEHRTPVGRTDFKSDERRQTSLVGSTPTLFRQFLSSGSFQSFLFHTRGVVPPLFSSRIHIHE